MGAASVPLAISSGLVHPKVGCGSILLSLPQCVIEERTLLVPCFSRFPPAMGKREGEVQMLFPKGTSPILQQRIADNE